MNDTKLKSRILKMFPDLPLKHVESCLFALTQRINWTKDTEYVLAQIYPAESEIYYRIMYVYNRDSATPRNWLQEFADSVRYDPALPILKIIPDQEKITIVKGAN